MALNLDLIIKKENLINFEKVLYEYADKFVELYRAKLKSEDLYVSGDLYDSITCTPVINGAECIVTFNAKDYYEYIEFGTKPHYAPIKSILEWVEVKLKLPKEQQLSTAYAIQKTIAREGTIKRYGRPLGGSHILAQTVAELNKEYIPKLEQALQDDADKVVFDVIEKIGEWSIW